VWRLQHAARLDAGQQGRWAEEALQRVRGEEAGEGGMSDYSAFIASKTHAGADDGFRPLWLPEYLMPFQASLTEWAVRKGRGALLADCGLGKSVMSLVWAENVCRHSTAPPKPRSLCRQSAAAAPVA